jgi:transcriptional regulator with XRE-family HTH domain
MMPKVATPKSEEPLKARLRRLRERAGFTPSSLAHAVNVTEGAIRQMESGQTKSPSFAVGLLLARELGVDPAYLAFGDAGMPGSGRSAAVQPKPTAALERRVEALERALRTRPPRRRP